jgi:anthranilate phosphoribosyltransferase
MTEMTFSCARFIKEIGRGPNGARPLSRDDAHDLYSAMLNGRVTDVELGAVLLAYRLKGETPAELSGMLVAAHSTLDLLATPAGAHRAVSIPSYNGARKQANLTPLLALRLAREGVPVLVHGVTEDPGRVTSAEIFARLGVAAAAEVTDINEALARNHVAFAPISTLSPRLARLLSLRRVLGVRNSTHTLVKLLQPFREPGLRLVNYTHPAYRDSLSSLFREHPEIGAGGALLARGTEGEAVADTRRQVQIDWLHDGIAETLIEPERRDTDAPPVVLPDREADATARWIEAALAGDVPTPPEIERQVETIKRLVAKE